jgi:hypothetical protein
VQTLLVMRERSLCPPTGAAEGGTPCRRSETASGRCANGAPSACATHDGVPPWRLRGNGYRFFFRVTLHEPDGTRLAMRGNCRRNLEIGFPEECRGCHASSNSLPRRLRAVSSGDSGRRA